MNRHRAPRLRRRSLTSLLAVSGGMLLATGCGSARPAPTSAEVSRDPLAVLDPGEWNARSAEELRALSVQGAADELETWADLGAEESFLDPARDTLTGFVKTAYLSPEELSGLDHEAAHDRVSNAAPEFWQEGLRTAWDGGDRPFYAAALAPPFRAVGRPALAADWYRTEQEDKPALALGTTIAWTVIDTTTRAVGQFAYRLGIVAEIDEDGGASAAAIRLSLHGMDGCGIAEHEGLLVPTLAGEEAHRSVQEATWDEVLSSPRIPLEHLLDKDSSLFAGDDTTYLPCE